MARVFIDTRSCFGWREATDMAGALGLDLIALVPDIGPSLKTINSIKKRLAKKSSTSKMRTVEIPHRTVDAIETVRDLAHSNDVILTDSCLFAFEFMVKVGAAVNNRGYEYTDPEILDQIKQHNHFRELMRQGLNPYPARKYHQSDCKRLQKSLERILADVCGMPKQDVHDAWVERNAQCIRKSKKKSTKQGTDLVFPVGSIPEMRLSTKVYVDGDACSSLPIIIEQCGSVGVPVVYVCNREVKNLVAEECKRTPRLNYMLQRLPEITLITTPKHKNAVDNAIRNSICPYDIVLTNDIDLMVSCVNKGASAMDFSGRTYTCSEGEWVGRKTIRQMREDQGNAFGLDNRKTFEASLQRTLTGYKPYGRKIQAVDTCQVTALGIAEKWGHVTTGELCEETGRGNGLCLRALKELTSLGVLEWHGSSTHDPTQYYSLAC